MEQDRNPKEASTKQTRRETPGVHENAAPVEEVDSVNLLRDKTFNQELRDLVDRVRENESSDTGGAPLSGKEEELAREILIFKLHQLFYRFRNLHHYDTINPSYNPFDTYIPDELSNDREIIAEQISSIMQSSGYDAFFIMTYDMNQKCFSADILTGDQVSGDDIIISIRDTLYHNIYESSEGYLVNADELSGNEFLKKIFYPEKATYQSLYLVNIDKITGILEDKNTGIKRKPSSNYQPPPILGIFLFDTKKADAGGIYRSIRNRMALPLQLYMKNLPNLFNIDSSISFSELYSYLVLLFNYYLIEDNRVGIIIKIRKYGENFSFIIRYLISKMRNALDSESLLLHFTEKRIVILTNQDKERSVYGIITELNSIYENNFKYTLISQKNRSDYSWEIMKMLV